MTGERARYHGDTLGREHMSFVLAESRARCHQIPCSHCGCIQGEDSDAAIGANTIIVNRQGVGYTWVGLTMTELPVPAWTTGGLGVAAMRPARYFRFGPFESDARVLNAASTLPSSHSLFAII